MHDAHAHRPLARARQAAGDLWRLACIVSAAATAGATWIGRGLRARVTGADWHASREAGRSAAHACERLSGAFIKLGQFLSARPDLLGPDLRAGLARLQTSVAPVAWDDLVARPGTLADRLRGWGDAVERTALAAGSVAQVHRGRLPDGTIVVLKIKRPGIDAVFRRDLALMRAFLAAGARLPPFRGARLVESFDSIAGVILQQLDFTREQQTHARLGAHFAQARSVVVPALMPAHCGTDLIVARYEADARPLSDAAAADAPLRQAIALRALRCVYQMIFTDGLIHGDLHPGNLLVRADGTLVLVDFGIVAQLTRDERMAFVDFFIGFILADGAACAGVALRLADWIPPAFDRAAFVAAIDALVQRHARASVGTFQIGRFAFDMFDIQRRHGVVSTTQFVWPILAILMLEGALKTLDPDLDFKAAARPFVFGALSGVLVRRVD